ncbi:MAG: DUF4190 domain-containing protein [Phycisphaerae bacterium]
MATNERQCGNCGEPLTARGGLPPRFCPRCGRQLAPAPDPTVSSPVVASEGMSTPAIASLVVGIVGLPTPCGVPLGLLAIFLGVYARMKIEESRGALSGNGLAIAGIVLGVIASGLWLAVCAAAL